MNRICSAAGNEKRTEEKRRGERIDGVSLSDDNSRDGIVANDAQARLSDRKDTNSVGVIDSISDDSDLVRAISKIQVVIDKTSKQLDFNRNNTIDLASNRAVSPPRSSSSGSSSSSAGFTSPDDSSSISQLDPSDNTSASSISYIDASSLSPKSSTEMTKGSMRQPQVQSARQIMSHVLISKVAKRPAVDDLEADDIKRTRLTPEEVALAEERWQKLVDAVAVETAFVVRATERDEVDDIRNWVPIPKNYYDAINDPLYDQRWLDAINAEIQALTSNKTWKEVRTPEGTNQVFSRWVFNVKYNKDNSTDRFKARLIAREFSQIYEEDFESTFAPTIRIDSLRLLLAIMAIEDMKAEQIDVNNAFTESKLKDEIFMKAPSGVKVRKGCTLRLRRSLYGLKQSAMEWYHRCRKALMHVGFTPLEFDSCVFIRKDGAIIGVYVDDLLLLTPRGKQQMLNQIKAELSQQFKIKELGPVERILGIRVIRDRKARTVSLNQQPYIEKFLYEYRMKQDTAKPTNMSIADANSLHRIQDDEKSADLREYQKRIESTMFADVVTRPDYSFALSKLSSYMANPSEQHASAMKRFLRYVRSTMHYRICYSGNSDQCIIEYCDADFASDKEDRRSVSRYVFKLAGDSISWSSRKQKCVTTSTVEAELMALGPAVKHGIWLSNFVAELKRSYLIGPKQHGLRIYEDNTAAIKMINNYQIIERFKHIDVNLRFLRECTSNGAIHIEYCSTDKMTADECIKGLPAFKHRLFIEMLGLQSIE